MDVNFSDWSISFAWFPSIDAFLKACALTLIFLVFFTSQVAADTPVLTHAALREFSGRDGHALRIVINGKVLEFCGDTDNYFYTYFVKNNIGGTDFTLRFARGYYEPAFKFDANVKSAAEMEEAQGRALDDRAKMALLQEKEKLEHDMVGIKVVGIRPFPPPL